MVRAQQLLEGSAKLPDHCIDDLQLFRENYHQFLREMELWAEEVIQEMDKRLPKTVSLRLYPTRQFERAKPFRRKTAAQAQ